MESKKDHREKSWTVLRFEGYTVQRSFTCYTVAESRSPTERDPSGIKTYTMTFHSSITEALTNLSERIYSDKLKKRSKQGMDDIQSLIELTRTHNEEMKKLFSF